MNHQDQKKNSVIFFGFALVITVILITVTRNSIRFENKDSAGDFRAVAPVDNTDYILPEELYKKMLQKEGVFMIDTRSHDAYLIEHIENSVNIPSENLMQEYKKIDPEKTIVLVGSNYSDKETLSNIFDTLKNSDFKKLYVLSGGIMAWKEGYFPTISMGDMNSIEDLSKINYLNPLQLDIAIKNDYSAIIVDLRTKNEFNQGHIRGAINIPANELEKRSEELKKTKEIVIYSESELKDFQLAVKMHDLGFYATYILEGGIAGWQSRNLELAR
jgi:rhodanese-related sulfurtransferase